MSSNRLANEQSPYLLQHKDNPVHWLPWGEEAFARAAAEDKPILLSVGYAACHWCHVMAHESFEDPEIASLMNRNFVNVKVDREERPEVDKIYMDALHRLGEQGGWPLTIFLKPDGSPFWGGTYFPPTSRYGRPSFPHVLAEIDRIWREERHKIDGNSAAIMAALRTPPATAKGEATPLPDLAEASRVLIEATDFEHGGLRGAPKFPQVPIYDFLWRGHLKTGAERHREAVLLTLTNMCQGGIYDHLGGGFSRYSVDPRWLVPHFEKMLYDNALLISLMARICATETNLLFRQRIEETVSWLLSDMRTPIGTFAASFDADSEGEEGRYYVWTHGEIAATLPSDSLSLFCRTYEVTQGGNWEGVNILNRLRSQELLPVPQEEVLAACRGLLLERRKRRIPPGFDDKSLADWNGLAISALAEAGLLLDRPDWIVAAAEAFAALLASQWRNDTLHHSYRNGELRGGATADGYANMVAAALTLYTATADPAYVSKARELVAAAIRHLWDDVNGGFYFAPRQVPELIVRPRFGHDDATPNANATMLVNLAKLYHLEGNEDDRRRAERIVQAFAPAAAANPFAYGSLLAALDFWLDPLQAVIIGSPHAKLERELRGAVLALPFPQAVIQYRLPGSNLPPHHPAHGKSQLNGMATLYICRGTRCAPPVTESSQVAAALHSIS